MVVLVDRRFAVAIAFDLPFPPDPLAWLSCLRRAAGMRGVNAGAWGLGLTFVAAAVQQARVGLHPRYFNHNALYHLIQGAGLFLVFRGARLATRRREA